MMQTIISILLLTLIASESFSQKKDILYLWPGKVPGELHILPFGGHSYGLRQGSLAGLGMYARFYGMCVAVCICSML